MEQGLPLGTGYVILSIRGSICTFETAHLYADIG